MNPLDRNSERQFAEAQRKHSQSDVLGALRIYDALVGRGLRSPAVLVYRALALVQLGRDRDARQAAELAVEQLGDAASAALVSERSTLGVIYRRLGLPQPAERQLRLAYEAAPDNGAVRNNLALVLTQMGRFAEADPLFEQAMAELPEDAAPALNRARIALYSQDFERAEAMLKAAKDRQPGHADVFLLEGQLALAESDHERAFASLAKVLGKNPIHAEAWSQLALVESYGFVLEKLDQVLAALVKAKPTSGKLLATAVGIARKQLAWAHLAALEALLNDALEGDSDAMIDVGSMFLLLSANVSQRAHRMAAHNGFENLIARGIQQPRPAPPPRAGRKLKVGYLSSDLRGHAIGYLFVGVMEAHRHDDIEWLAYANWKDDGSEIRQRFRTAFDRFVNISDLPDADVAERMREDGIDVLVDLNQMTNGNRLGVFLHGPAPVTVQWLGMPGTVGAGKRIDYVLLDPWTGHPGNLDGFDEQPVILAGSYQPNDWQKPDLALAKTRADWKLPADVPVLCSFNQTQKFSPDTVALWADILRQVPDAVLWVLAGEAAIEERFLRIFSDAGIARNRILFAERAGHDAHVARLQHADLMLDNWPYNAHTTCSDALRAGTPVLTLPGPTFASRVAAGILDTVGLDDWIAATPEDYVAKAVAYCQAGRAGMDAVKQTVHERYWSSPMVDCAAFAQRLESFYETAFARAEREEKPTPCWVEWNGAVHDGLPAAGAWRQTVLADRPDGRSVADFAQQPGTRPTTVSPDATRSAPPSATGPGASAPSTAGRAIQKGSKGARLHNLGVLAESVLQLPTVPVCVDVGAKPEDPKVWDVLAQRERVKVVGFDPQCDDVVLDEKGYRTIVNCALGDGGTHTLHIAQADGMTSLLEADVAWLSRFPKFAEWGKVVRTVDLPTRCADDVAEIAHARFIKVDTQGSEKLILEHASRLLDESLVLMELELLPVPLYKGEPSLFEVGRWLEQRGWMLHHLPNLNRRMLKPLGQDDNPYVGIRHIFQVDAVFVPHVDRWPSFPAERLLDLAYLAHALYGSFDIAALALEVHDAKEGVLPRLPNYRRYLEEAGLDA